MLDSDRTLVQLRSYLLLGFFIGSMPAVHAQLPTHSEIYQYRAVDRQLEDVLRTFAADQRLNVVIDPSISSHTVHEEVQLPPEAFLDYITGKYGLVWYYDGTSLYIDRGDNLATKAFRLRYATPGRIIETMKVLNAYSKRYAFRVLEDENVVLVVGPARLLEMTAFVVETLESSGRTTASTDVSIAVFPLKFAAAADQSFDFQGATVTVPGVATILQSMVSGQPIPGGLTTYVPRDLPGLTGLGLNRYSQHRSAKELLFNREATPAYEHPNSAAALADQPSSPGSEAARQTQPSESINRGANTGQAIQAIISADTRINAVVVRDFPERMASYQKIVESLDQPTGLIEITARIIDIQKRGVLEWGLPIDVQRTGAKGTKQFSFHLTPTDSANLAVTLVKDEATQFMQKVKALEQDGYARVASRPSLLTLDNVEAQIDNSETFFVRVEGDFEVDLFDVSVGTTLNIIPHVIEFDGRRMVKLNVKVKDGAVLEQSVDEIPRVRNDSITTQAILGEHETLLIGGLIREEKSTSVSRVPLFGSLPGVGALFRTEEHNTSHVERLIMIEPRIVPLPSGMPEGLALGIVETQGGERLDRGPTSRCDSTWGTTRTPAGATTSEALPPPTSQAPPRLPDQQSSPPHPENLPHPPPQNPFSGQHTPSKPIPSESTQLPAQSINSVHDSASALSQRPIRPTPVQQIVNRGLLNKISMRGLLSRNHGSSRKSTAEKSVSQGTRRTKPTEKSANEQLSPVSKAETRLRQPRSVLQVVR